MNWLCISGKASNLNRLSRTRSTSPSAQFSIRAILSRVYVQLDARPIEKGCRKVVYSWKSSELESAEPCEEKHQKPRLQPNSVFTQFSVVCMFNWILGQLKKAVWRSSIRGKALNLNRLSSTRKNQKPRPQPNSVTRAIPSHVYVQLDARPVKEGCRKIVCSWKGSEFESAEQCEEISQKPRPQPNSVIRAIPSRVYVQLDARLVKEGYMEVVCSWKSSEFESAKQYEEESETSPSTQFSDSRDS